jgi:hypothetical protein
LIFLLNVNMFTHATIYIKMFEEIRYDKQEEVSSF